MKKAIIITAILFIISSIATMCFAVALGSEAIADFVKDNGASLKEHLHSGEEFFNYITEGEFNVGGAIQDGVEKIVSSAEVFSNTDFAIIGNSDYLVAGEKAADIPVLDKEEIKIYADVSSVIIKTTENQTMSVANDIYSKSASADIDDYTLILDREGYDVYLQAKKNNRNSVSELTVEIPESYEGKVIVGCAVGNVTIADVNLSENANKAIDFDVKVDVGNIKAIKSTVNSAKLAVDTGNIEVFSDFNCATPLDLKVEIGNVEYGMPTGRYINLIYNINTGSADTKEIDSVEGIMVTEMSQAGLSGAETSGSVKGAAGVSPIDLTLSVNIEVGIGSIEFKIIK